uniref:Uncharacterized protein n=1 Tax=Arion vulgaris TaxID=1028688 RepID=A0A0B6YXH7_9EUPU
MTVNHRAILALGQKVIISLPCDASWHKEKMKVESTSVFYIKEIAASYLLRVSYII